MLKEGYTKVTVIVPDKLKEIISADAKYDGRSVSNYICRLLMKHYSFETNEDDD